MKIGLQLASFTWPGGPRAMASRFAEIARTAEEAGFYSVWVMNHHLQIPPWGKPEEHPMLVNIDADPANLRRFGTEVIRRVA